MIVESNSFCTNEIIKIKYCRLYLQVHNLSDITNGFGSVIDYCAIHHIRDPDKVRIYNWPFKPNPSKLWSHFEQRRLHLSLVIHIRTPPFKSSWLYRKHSEILYYKILTMSHRYTKKRVTF